MHYADDTSQLVNPPADNWRPTYWTPMKTLNSLGDDIADFMEMYLTPPRKSAEDLAQGYNFTEADIAAVRITPDKYAGQKRKYRLAPYQRWLLQHIFEIDETENFRYTEVYIQISRKNFKSMAASGILCYFAVKGKNGDEMYVAAKDSNQAKVVFNEVGRNVKNSPELKLVLEVKQDEITNKYVDTLVKKLSSSSDSTFGFAPYISIGDELWCWDSEFGYSDAGAKMVASLTTGSGDRAESMFIGITTAGSNLEGLAYARYDKGKMIAQGHLEDDTFGFFCWEAEEHDAIDNPQTWFKANPSLEAGLMPFDKFEKAFKSAEAISTTDFERFNLNKWLKKGDKEQYIQSFYWRQIEDKSIGVIPDGARVSLGFDGSLTDDSTGIVAIDLDTGLMELLYSWENDRTDPNWFVDVGEVEAAMTKVFAKYDVIKLYADPSRHQETIKKWQRDFGKNIVRDIPPNAKRMVPMGDEFRADIYKAVLKHAGNKRFTEHVNNAVLNIRGLPQKEKPKSPYKIDFLICAILANGARAEAIDAEERKAKKRAIYGDF